MKSKPFLDLFSRKNKIQNGPKTKEKIIIDYREQNSRVISKLKNLGLETELRELKVADYIVKDVAIERKTVSDFLASMLNKRLLKQIEELKQYKNRLILIEGIEEKDLYTDDNLGINANAIRGFLLSIALKHKIPVLFTKNEEDTAKFIYVLVKKQDRNMSLKAKKKAHSKKEQMQFILEGFPGIGPTIAKKLLTELGTIQNIINAPKENLQKILGKKSESFLELIESKY